MTDSAGTPPFSGFGPGAVAWFEGLAEDNSREYWAATKDAWQAEVRAPLEALLGELAAAWGGEVRLFRQHRDVRFSRDKSPLKTTTYGVATRPGSEAGLYVAVSADGLVAGTGYHELARDQLERYRAGVLDDAAGSVLQAAVAAAEDAGLELGPPALKGTPRGVPARPPAGRPAAVHLHGRLRARARQGPGGPGRAGLRAPGGGGRGLGHGLARCSGGPELGHPRGALCEGSPPALRRRARSTRERTPSFR